MGNFISEQYTVAVSDVKFDTVISTFNRVQDSGEYIKTLESIRSVGQIDPIYLDSGLCIDGRHRCKALKELGMEYVTVIDVNPELLLEDKLQLANKDLVSGRDLNKTQLAIQAYKFATLTKQAKSVTARQFGIPTKNLTFASEVYTYLPEAYKAFETVGKAKVGDKYTSSLQMAYNYVNANIKGEDEEDTSSGVVNYDVLIKTSKGIELFWDIYEESLRPNSVLAMHLVDYVNIRFRKVTTK